MCVAVVSRVPRVDEWCVMRATHGQCTGDARDPRAPCCAWHAPLARSAANQRALLKFPHDFGAPRAAATPNPVNSRPRRVSLFGCGVLQPAPRGDPGGCSRLARREIPDAAKSVAFSCRPHSPLRSDPDLISFAARWFSTQHAAASICSTPHRSATPGRRPRARSAPVQLTRVQRAGASRS